MPSPLENFFDDNLFKVCSDKHFLNVNCVLGSFEFFLGLIILLLTIKGMINMIKYYDKFNFEISLLLVSIFQIILMNIIIIVPHDFLYEIFFLIQLFIISLIIRKFWGVTGMSKFLENLIFIIINIINIAIFTFYILSLSEIFLSESYLHIRFSSRIFYFLATVNLTFLCRSLIKKLEKYETRNESYDLYFKKSISEFSNKSEHFVINFNSAELFFMIRKKQIIPLYILNLICSFIQMLFIVLKNFVFTDYFKKIDNKLISTTEGYIIYYIQLLAYFLNIMINYICFYWIIRDQYNNDSELMKRDKRRKRKILDEAFIERESLQTSREEQQGEIFSKDSNKNKKRYKKSMYSNTFTEEDNEDQEKYFVKENQENKEIKEENKEKKDVEEGNKERKSNLSQNVLNNSTNDSNIIFS